MSLQLNDSGTGFLTVENVFTDLGAIANPFKGNWMQLVKAELWGGYGISGGSCKRQVVTLADMQTGISVSDRGALEQVPRVGLEWPLAARTVYNHLSAEQLFQVTSNDGAGGKAEFYLLLTIIGW